MNSNAQNELANALARSNTLAAATNTDGSRMQDVDLHAMARMIGELIGEAIDQPAA